MIRPLMQFTTDYTSINYSFEWFAQLTEKFNNSQLLNILKELITMIYLVQLTNKVHEKEYPEDTLIDSEDNYFFYKINKTHYNKAGNLNYDGILLGEYFATRYEKVGKFDE